MESNYTEQWAIEFDDWIIKHMHTNDKDALFNWENNAPHAQLAVPRTEHFVPLFIAMGSGENSGEVIHRSYELGTLSYLCSILKKKMKQSLLHLFLSLS